MEGLRLVLPVRALNRIVSILHFSLVLIDSVSSVEAIATVFRATMSPGKLSAHNPAQVMAVAATHTTHYAVGDRRRRVLPTFHSFLHIEMPMLSQPLSEGVCILHGNDFSLDWVPRN